MSPTTGADIKVTTLGGHFILADDTTLSGAGVTEGSHVTTSFRLRGGMDGGGAMQTDNTRTFEEMCGVFEGDDKDKFDAKLASATSTAQARMGGRCATDAAGAITGRKALTKSIVIIGNNRKLEVSAICDMGKTIGINEDGVQFIVNLTPQQRIVFEQMIKRAGKVAQKFDKPLYIKTCQLEELKGKLSLRVEEYTEKVEDQDIGVVTHPELLDDDTVARVTSSTPRHPRVTNTNSAKMFAKKV